MVILPHYLDIVRGVHFILLNNMPLHPIGIRLNGWDIDPNDRGIGSFKFHSKFKVLPKADLSPHKEHSYEPKLISPLKQISDQTKEEQKRINDTSQSSIRNLNMNIGKPKRKAIKLANKNDINILAYPRQAHSSSSSRKRKTTTNTNSSSKSGKKTKKDSKHSTKRSKAHSK